MDDASGATKGCGRKSNNDKLGTEGATLKRALKFFAWCLPNPCVRNLLPLKPQREAVAHAPTRLDMLIAVRERKGSPDMTNALKARARTQGVPRTLANPTRNPAPKDLRLPFGLGL